MSNKFEKALANYKALLETENPSTLDKVKLEQALWFEYTESFAGKTPHKRYNWFASIFSEPAANYNYRARMHMYAFPKNAPPSKIVPAVLQQVDAGKLSLNSATMLITGVTKIATEHGATYERALEVALAHYHDSPKYTLDLDYDSLLSIENKFTPTTGLQFKKAVMHLAAEFAKSTRAIGQQDPYGESIQKSFLLNLSECVADYLSKISTNRREQSVFLSVQISHEEFEWACVTLGIDRKKIGDYGSDIRMDLVGKRYRQQIALVHPDRNPSEAAQKMFASIKEAKELLDKYNLIRTTK